MSSRFFFACLVLVVAPTAGFSQSFEALMALLPDDTNAALAIDVERVMQSPYIRLRDGKIKNPSLDLPEGTTKLLVGAKLDSTGDFARLWEIGLIETKTDISMAEVVRTEGGELDTIAGLEAAWLSNESYAVRLGEDRLAVRYPADRQAMTRWVSRVTGNADTKVTVSQQITRLLEIEDEDGPQMTIALDLFGMPQPHRLRSRLEGHELLERHALKLDDVVELFTSIRGLVFEVTLTSRIDGVLRVDFDNGMNLTAKAGRDFLLDALRQLDMELPGLEDWRPAATSHAIQLSGELSPSGLRRLLSLVGPPKTDYEADQESSAAAKPDMAKTSKQYYDSVVQLVDDLEESTSKYKNDSVWFDRYAEKIDRLPILHVDPELVDFGLKTAETIREMSYRRKINRAQTGQRNASLRATGTGGSYGYSYSNRYGVRSSYYDNGDVDGGRAVTANQAISNSQNAMTKIEGFKLIKDAQSQIRRTMTERYQIEF